MHTLDKRGSVTPSEYGGASSFASSELAYPGKRIQRWQEVRALCPGPPQSPGSDVHSKLSANAFWGSSVIRLLTGSATRRADCAAGAHCAEADQERDVHDRLRQGRPPRPDAVPHPALRGRVVRGAREQRGTGQVCALLQGGARCRRLARQPVPLLLLLAQQHRGGDGHGRHARGVAARLARADARLPQTPQGDPPLVPRRHAPGLLRAARAPPLPA